MWSAREVFVVGRVVGTPELDLEGLATRVGFDAARFDVEVHQIYHAWEELRPLLARPTCACVCVCVIQEGGSISKSLAVANKGSLFTYRHPSCGAHG